jgi:DNA-binding MarR family transcriptional regulator
MKREKPPGVPIARLSAMVFRTLIDDVHAAIESRGFRDVGASYGYVLLEARNGALTVTEVARLLGVTKQAASKLVSGMQQSGYLLAATSEDLRARRVEISARGRRLLEHVEAIYAELEAQWATVIGQGRVEAIRSDLTKVLIARHGALPSVRPTNR